MGVNSLLRCVVTAASDRTAQRVEKIWVRILSCDVLSQQPVTVRLKGREGLGLNPSSQDVVTAFSDRKAEKSDKVGV